ncbi:unnamed protein product [Rotaria sordida]|uniref:FLYWCH-type domain-containing protein n=1 Tax=Rotaria sordida TaxID=392033 RepID=A0A813SKT6_9BILA|nr:unnamed protein product [Rotaria sordida]CAF0813860.1 unnamed protein product [Rotaria sordida]
MSIVSDNTFSEITTQFDNKAIVFKNYHFGLRRTKKDGSQVWICTHKLCNSTITIHEGAIIKTSLIKADGNHEFEHPQKMALNVYECITSIKRKIEEEPTATVSLLYDQQVNKFRKENGSAAAVPVFDRIKSSLYEYRSSQHPPIPKSLSTIDVPERLTTFALLSIYQGVC